MRERFGAEAPAHFPVGNPHYKSYLAYQTEINQMFDDVADVAKLSRDDAVAMVEAGRVPSTRGRASATSIDDHVRTFVGGMGLDQRQTAELISKVNGRGTTAARAAEGTGK